jgi:hypothetical protein
VGIIIIHFSTTYGPPSRPWVLGSGRESYQKRQGRKKNSIRKSHSNQGVVQNLLLQRWKSIHKGLNHQLIKGRTIIIIKIKPHIPLYHRYAYLIIEIRIKTEDT